jgi:Smg protein
VPGKPGFLRYIGTMFEVLVFVYENYYAGDSYPEPAHLERKLNAVGFESEEIEDALTWLSGLNTATRGSTGCVGTAQPVAPEPWLREPCPSSMRIYPLVEQNHLGQECMGFISFLESAGVLPASMREVIIERAMAAPGEPVSLDDLKIIILMVYWSFGQEPDALVLDELCEDNTERIAH